MSEGIAEQIIKRHLVEGKFEPGAEIGIRIDQTLTQDATGTMVYLQFESLGLSRLATELSVSYIDHNTIQDGFENADDHKYLQTTAAKCGAYFSRPGNGICHQVHLERFGAPGKTLLGSDSHTPTGGALGMLAIGAGGIDVALAMAGAPFYLACPRIIRVNLEGRLGPWASAKDVILALLKILTTKGNAGAVIEYGGGGVGGLSVQQRATIANMGAELGVTASVFPSDAVTRDFLTAQGRAECWRAIAADEGARCERVIDIDLASIRPMAAKPHSPDNVAAVADIAGVKVDQVAIGSCTNASFEDMAKAAGILKGRRVHPDVSLVVAPASRQVFAMLAESGALSIFLEAGARVLEPVCGFCIGNCHAPRSGGVSLRTTNRNFKGRSGTRDSDVYLVSPETAAASAIAGVITDPSKSGTDHGIECKSLRYPVDDSMIIPPLPESDREAVQVVRGPNIGKPLALSPLDDALRGRIELEAGDKITTDDIMPAGARLKYRSNIEKYSQFVFENLDANFSRRCLENKAAGKSSFIVAGWSYGQGSSREHAAICPRFLGVRAVLAASFERIHFANLVNYGILPLVFASREDRARFHAGDEIDISGLRAAVKEGGSLVVVNRTAGAEIRVKLDLSNRQREILMDGGALNHAAKNRAGR